MKVKRPSVASIQAWQTCPPTWYTIMRVSRFALSLGLFAVQLPFIVLDTIFRTNYYGRPSWSFSFRVLRLLGAYAMWSMNPGTRPPADVLSYSARSSPGKLKGNKRAHLVEVPPRPEKCLGDLVFENVVPETCPCFWQWLEGVIPSPLENPTPVGERKVIIYFVGGGMVQGHPCETPLSWHMIQASHLPIFGVNFRKCVTKETAFPAAVQDAVAAFYFLLSEGYRAENVCISGDSGGGGVAVTAILYLRKHGLAMPGSAVLVSPFVDLVDDFLGNEEYLNLDFLNPEPLAMVQYQYTENRPDLKGSLLSPSQNKLPDGYTFVGFPRAFISYGEVEMFRPSIIRLVEILRTAGVKVQVDKGKDQVHDYPTYTKDRSVDGFFGQLKPFLEDHGQYEEAFVLV